MRPDWTVDAGIAGRECKVLKVLVVDDSGAVQQSLGRLLGAAPGVCVVGYAEDVAGALRQIEAAVPDVVVLDADLRGGDRGIDVLRYVVRQHPSIRVIGLSNFNWQALRDNFLAAGAQAYFDKSTEFTDARDWIVALQRRAGDNGSSDH